MNFVELVFVKLGNFLGSVAKSIEREVKHPEPVIGFCLVLWALMSALVIQPDLYHNYSGLWLKMIFLYAAVTATGTTLLNFNKPLSKLKDKCADIAVHVVLMVMWLVFANVSVLILTILF